MGTKKTSTSKPAARAAAASQPAAPAPAPAPAPASAPAPATLAETIAIEKPPGAAAPTEDPRDGVIQELRGLVSNLEATVAGLEGERGKLEVELRNVKAALGAELEGNRTLALGIGGMREGERFREFFKRIAEEHRALSAKKENPAAPPEKREDLLALLRPLLYVPPGHAGLKTIRVGKWAFVKEPGSGRHVCRFANWEDFVRAEREVRDAGQGVVPILTDLELNDGPLPVAAPAVNQSTPEVPPTHEELVQAAIEASRSRVATRRAELRLMPSLRRRERIDAAPGMQLPLLGDEAAEVELLMRIERPAMEAKLEQALRKLRAKNIAEIVAQEFPAFAEAEAAKDAPTPRAMPPSAAGGFDPEPELPAGAVADLNIDDLRAYAAHRGVTERTREDILRELGIEALAAA